MLRDTHMDLSTNDLLQENRDLEIQYQATQTQITALTLENQALKKRLSAFTQQSLIQEPPQPPELISEDMKVCNNCGQTIPTINYEMHSMHCERMHKKCSVCHQLFTIQDYEVHIQDQGSNIQGLFQAAETGQLTELQARLSHGIPLLSLDNTQNSLLHSAVHSSNLDLLTYLLSQGCPINHLNLNGETPLHIALDKRWRNYQVVTLLLQRGGDPMTPNKLGDSPYALAMRMSDPALMLCFTQAQGIDGVASPMRSGSARLRGRFKGVN